MEALSGYSWGSIAVSVGRTLNSMQTIAAKVVATTANSLPKIPFERDIEGDLAILGVKLPTWREWIVTGGLFFAVTLTALSFITGATLVGWSYLILSGIALFGAYYYWQWTQLAPLAEQVDGLRQVQGDLRGEIAGLQEERARDRVEREREREERTQERAHQKQLANALVTLLEAVGKKDDKMTEEWRSIAGDLDGNIDHLDRLVAALPAQLAETTREVREVLQLSQRERDARLAEIEAANRRFGHLLGLIEAKAAELERLNGAADRVEAHAVNLGGIVAQLRAFHDAIAKGLPSTPPEVLRRAAAGAVRA